MRVIDHFTLEANNPSMDLSRCIVCQLQTDEELVENPSSYEHFVHSISVRASYREAKYVEIWANLKEYNSQELNLKRQHGTGSYTFWNDKKIKREVSLKNKAKHEHVVILLYFHRLRMRKLDCLEKTKECFSLLRNFSQNM